MSEDQLNPVVAQFVDTLNAGDSSGFFDLLTSDAIISDDGADRDIRKWAGSEAFGSNGHLHIESITDGGTELVAIYSNTRWGTRRSAWRFTVSGGKISRVQTKSA
ncbi:nuclear transport factor 2 family protein [Streptomyces sp. Go40/10]|uniref:nuclear transport factor 2 family protein n=1 Tax=Streptomyces sp. Go40/10 TaxID=2825844 RepID=UPI001E51B7E0|nr:nuclear transport factor 2 family protein [Streptomyces sp. Go40/10]UFQ99890.1 nuclear transport factor 2 family protein [Streptomyces sp. Go40/10]